MKTEHLKSGYYIFGNKGSVWNNLAHIAKSGSSTTLCGTPMLSTNHARLQNVKEIGCPKCLAIYTGRGLVKLDSVGAYLLVESQTVAPMLENGNVDYENQVLLSECTKEWYESLDRFDASTLELIKKSFKF